MLGKDQFPLQTVIKMLVMSRVYLPNCKEHTLAHVAELSSLGWLEQCPDMRQCPELSMRRVSGACHHGLTMVSPSVLPTAPCLSRVTVNHPLRSHSAPTIATPRNYFIHYPQSDIGHCKKSNS